jgi:hypothetical protein
MKRLWLTLVLVCGAVLLTAGCYEIKLDVQVYPTGEALVTHTVSMPAAAVRMRLSALKRSDTDVLDEMRAQAEQDARVVGGTRVVDVKVIPGENKLSLRRRFLLDDPAKLKHLLALFGLDAEYKKGCFSQGFTAQAATLDERKLARLGPYFEQRGESEPSVNAMAAKEAASFTLTATLPGPEKVAEPEGAWIRGARVWSVPEERYGNAFVVRLQAGNKHAKLPALQTATPLDGRAIDAVLATLPGHETADFTRRLGGRLLPVIHVRMDKKGRADLAILWRADELISPVADYHGNLDALAMPDLAAAYFPFVEVLNLEGETVVAEGYRRYRPFDAKQLTGALRVNGRGKNGAVSLQLPQVFVLETVGERGGTSGRPVAVLVATFAGGATTHRVLTVDDLRQGRKVVLSAGQ